MEDIIAHYHIGTLVEARKIESGYVNESYQITTVANGRRQCYFLRAYQPRSRESRIRFEHSLIAHLLAEGFAFTPALIATRSGATYVKKATSGTELRFFAIYQFLEGPDTHSWDHPACSARELASAAAILARYHAAVVDFAYPQIAQTIVDILPVIAAKAKACLDGRSQFSALLSRYIKDLLVTIDDIAADLDRQNYTQLPHLAIHGDYHPGNLKFCKGKVTGVYDFDWAKMDTRVFDVALALTYFATIWQGASAGSLALDTATSFVNSYQQTLRDTGALEPLTTMEIFCLIPLIRAANVYILLWIMDDFSQNQLPQQQYLYYLERQLRLMQWLKHNKRVLEKFLGDQ